MATVSNSECEFKSSLMATKLVNRAVSLVLTDEGFSLPTVPARTSQKAAEKILEWSSESNNQTPWENFCKSIVTKLGCCFESPTQLGRMSKQREKMWAQYHQIRSEQSYKSFWLAFFESCGCKDLAHPLFYQFVTDSIMEQLIKIQYPPISRELNDENVTFDSLESSAVRYAAGYVIRSLTSKIDRSKLDQKVELSKCLQEMAENDPGECVHHSAQWTRAVDRGGLVHVDDTVYSLFAEIELFTRKHLKSQSAQNVDIPSTVDLIIKNENVLFAWSIVSASWEQDTADILLRMIANHWVNMRGFSFAKSLLERYKQNVKRTVQKSKGLRKQLQTSN